ncbi:unnamed protein product [Acanthoscelides obtectus]|uniref:Uncharacterized protein n=1 Tax=Acanthoscelides obtectus TaxID=200917 RepID=A0A9P0L6X3_ACAOB|nr:unnamed protein product [Acanthoscelides obtectus]CAK1638320.1 hypothetical protein AOBTE_LOCUS10533 [Acanthoscelides obtectus]
MNRLYLMTSFGYIWRTCVAFCNQLCIGSHICRVTTIALNSSTEAELIRQKFKD